MKNEIFKMFKYPSMIKSGAFCAAAFAFVSVVFKTSIVLIPEVTEIRFCNMFTCAFGIWFGPAGALGCAVGNLIGDLGGSLTMLSFPGFAANFVSAWIPYKIWEILGSAMGESNTERPSLKSKKWLFRYFIGGIVSVAGCSAVLALAFEARGDMSVINTFMMIFLNNFADILLGTVIFILMNKVPKKALPYWREQMTDERVYVFPERHKRKIYFSIFASFAIMAYVAAYMLFSGVTFKNPDDFGNVFAIAAVSVYLVLQVALMVLCRWEERKDGHIQSTVSLD